MVIFLYNLYILFGYNIWSLFYITVTFCLAIMYGFNIWHPRIYCMKYRKQGVHFSWEKSYKQVHMYLVYTNPAVCFSVNFTFFTNHLMSLYKLPTTDICICCTCFSNWCLPFHFTIYLRYVMRKMPLRHSYKQWKPPSRPPN